MFEPVHGSAPKYAGLDKADPTALVLSAVLMLAHLGEAAAAHALFEAVRTVIGEGKRVTYDLGGTSGHQGHGRGHRRRGGQAALGGGARVSPRRRLPGAGRGSAPHRRDSPPRPSRA